MPPITQYLAYGRYFINVSIASKNYMYIVSLVPLVLWDFSPAARETRTGNVSPPFGLGKTGKELTIPKLPSLWPGSSHQVHWNLLWIFPISKTSSQPSQEHDLTGPRGCPAFFANLLWPPKYCLVSFSWAIYTSSIKLCGISCNMLILIPVCKCVLCRTMPVSSFRTETVMLHLLGPLQGFTKGHRKSDK